MRSSMGHTLSKYLQISEDVQRLVEDRGTANHHGQKVLPRDMSLQPKKITSFPPHFTKLDSARYSVL